MCKYGVVSQEFQFSVSFRDQTICSKILFHLLSTNLSILVKSHFVSRESKIASTSFSLSVLGLSLFSSVLVSTITIGVVCSVSCQLSAELGVVLFGGVVVF